MDTRSVRTSRISLDADGRTALAAGGTRTPRILVIDNYDSFVYNLVQYLGELGARCVVRRNDEVAVDDLDGSAGLDVDAVLISPGPGTPEDAGASVEIVRACARRTLPLLGVCLGHQAIAVAYGATVAHAPELMHGKTSAIRHDGAGVFADLPDPFTATRYHSLTVLESTLPAELVVTAWTDSGVVMGIRHASLPIVGVQFHPESVLTQGGHLMLGRWLESLGAAMAMQHAPQLAANLARLQAQALRST